MVLARKQCWPSQPVETYDAIRPGFCLRSLRRGTTLAHLAATAHHPMVSASSARRLPVGQSAPHPTCVDVCMEQRRILSHKCSLCTFVTPSETFVLGPLRGGKTAHDVVPAPGVWYNGCRAAKIARRRFRASSRRQHHASLRVPCKALASTAACSQSQGHM